MKAQTYVALVGAVLIVAGIILGLFVPVSVDGPGRSVDCGRAWGSAYEDAVNASNSDPSSHDYRVDCRNSRGTRGTLALVLVGLGAVVAAGGFVGRPRRTEQQQAP